MYRSFFQNIVAATALFALFSVPGGASDGAEDARLNLLYGQLKGAEAQDARRIGEEIRHELSKTGSPSMDLLVKRGRDAMEARDTRAAIGHFTALTDHAPEFAEGWHMRSVVFARAGMPGLALADLERSLGIDPRNFAAIYSLGAVLEQVEQPELAREAYARVAAIHPHFDDISETLSRLDEDLRGSDL